MNFWSMEDSRSLATYDLPDATGERITALAAAPFSNDVAVAYDLPQPQVRFIFTPTGEGLGNMLQATSQVTQLAFSYNGVSLAFAMQDGSLTLWTLETNELTELREPSEKLLTDVRYSPNNELIAASGENGMVVLWNPQTAERVITLENDGAARSLSFSADSLWLAVGYDDGAVRLWDMESYTVFQTIPSVGAQANAVAFSPDGTQVAVGYSNGTVEFYTISQPE